MPWGLAAIVALPAVPFEAGALCCSWQKQGAAINTSSAKCGSEAV